MRRRRRRKAFRLWLLAALFLLLGVVLWGFSRLPPEDLPWTPLDLGAPVGAFTGRKIAALDDEPAQCRSLLDVAGIEYESAPPLGIGSECPIGNALKLGGGARTIVFHPNSPSMACPVAAALVLWEWHVLEPAAQRLFSQRVEAIDHLGSYNCRRIADSESNSWSQHANANAIDITGFRLADGTRISVRDDWAGNGAKAQFLRAARDGACDLFATVLSPDYNAAHADHFHMDQARRNLIEWRACR